MKNNLLYCLVVVLLGFINQDAHAAPIRGKKIPQKQTVAQPAQIAIPTPTIEKNNDLQNYNRIENRFYLFGGIDLGLGAYSKSEISTDVSKSGLAVGVRALAAYYSKKWVTDGGFGFTFISSSGVNATNDNLKVFTRTIFADISARYRMNKNWQFGPELQYWFGTDNGLNADIFSNESNKAFLCGFQLVYEWMDQDEPNKYRLGAKWNTDLNIAERNINLFQIFFQIGFSPGGGREEKPKYSEELKQSDLEQVEPEPMPMATPVPTPEEPIIAEPEPEVMSTPAPVVAGPQEKMVMTLDVNSLPFETDNARLPKYNRDRVKEIGRFLGENNKVWTKLIVSGHTDEQGKKPYNIKLSKARAETVRQLLGEGGAPINKIKAVGLGSSQPIAKGHNEKSWSKNRRVELEFIGVKDGLVIQKAFKN